MRRLMRLLLGRSPVAAAPRRSARRRPVPRRHTQRRSALRLNWRGLGILGLSLALLAGLMTSLWFWRSGRADQLADRALAAGYRLSADLGFSISSVLVEGRVRTPRGAILEALGVHRGAPILAFDLFASRERLRSLSWVAQASVERRLPSIIYVRIEERQPIAIWQSQGRLSVIDAKGAVIAGVKAARFAKLPLVVGAGAPEHTADLLHMLASEPKLKHRVSAAIRVGERRWNLRVDDMIDVRLPEIEAANAWAKLAKIDREHGILSRNVSLIDLRLPDRLVVRPNPGFHPQGGGKEQST